MIRRGVTCVAAPGSVFAASQRQLSVTSVALQLQHRDRRIGGTHGAGVVKHDSMAKFNSATQRAPRGVSQAAPAADLFRTQAHEGLGTSASDPYQRTLPNVESRAPESTVLHGVMATAATLEETATLGKKWASMQYWIGDTHPRLPMFLRSLMVPDPLPVSAHAERLISDFSAQLPHVMRDAGEADRAKMAAVWAAALEAYGAVGVQNIFDRAAFEAGLAEVHAGTVAAATAVPSSEGALLAFEVLRRKAVLKRNRFLEDGLARVVESGTYLGFGDGIWRVFFAAVERNKAAVFGPEANRLVSFAWEAVMREDAARTPSISAIVALYLTLASIAQSDALVDSAHRATARRVDDGVANLAAATRRNGADVNGQALSKEALQLVNPIVKRKFAKATLEELLNSTAGSENLSKALRASGFHELSREAALCEAMNDDARLLAADTETLVQYFDSTQEVRSLLAQIVSGINATAKAHVLQTFGIPSAGGSVDWEKTFLAVDWDSNWRRLTMNLLSDSATLVEVRQVVKNAIGAKGSFQRLFSPAYEAELARVTGARSERVRSKAAKIAHIVGELSSYNLVDASIAIMAQLGVPMGPLPAEAAAVEDHFRRSRPVIDAAVLESIVAEIGRRHPSWVQAGVLPLPPADGGGASLSLSAGPDGRLDVAGLTRALELMVRMYVRLAYVPQAGAATVAQHTRRRIGPIGTEPHQHNVPAEVGFVEQYDNLQYKRYDWQGWYQRMTDVHNRNVSIRCRIDDLKRLDGHGNPFVDLQTERRLRILAGDRVGMGVVKLDSDKFEDQSDNITYGTGKLSEVLAESRKAQLGPEYWPTVEVKVRRPSGQSQAYYSTIDSDRIEKRSAELYEKYRDAKKRSLFVTPMDLWLEVKGMQARKAADTADADGYTLDSLQDSLGDE